MIVIFDKISSNEIDFNVFLGFDGFVDKIYKAYKTKNGDVAVPFGTTSEFYAYLAEKAGKSLSVDLELIQEKLGGNMPIVANALANLGCQTVCVGAMGFPEINPIFKSMNPSCDLATVTQPGCCSSIEFEDGKLMLATNTYIDKLDYSKIIEAIPEEKLVRYFEQCDAAAFLNWGEMINSNDIWRNIYEHVVPQCKFTAKKLMLVDFSDFSKRASGEVDEMRGLLEKYSRIFDITVSVNDNELGLLIEKLGLGIFGEATDAQILALHEKLACKNLVIHLVDETKYVKGSSVHVIPKEVIERPKIITGGGDNFNAGLLFGLLIELGIEDSIRVGSALSCLYVRDAENVSFSKLKSYFK